MLMLSIDERDDEDLEAQTAAIPFVINEELAVQYGQNFSITLDEKGMPKVTALA